MMTINRTFVTGDTHGFKHFKHLMDISTFYENDLTENDVIIILGEATLTWHNDTCKNLKKILMYDLLPCKIAIVDGNHENFETLYNYPVVEMYGGTVRKITNKICYLERGQVYTLNTVKIFAFGGGYSYDSKKRIPYVDWWPQEMPTMSDMRRGLQNLDEHNWSVDYLLTHTCGLHDLVDLEAKTGLDFIHGRENPEYNLNFYISELKKRLLFDHHYCGHFHQDMTVNKKTTFLFESYYEITKYP